MDKRRLEAPFDSEWSVIWKFDSTKFCLSTNPHPQVLGVQIPLYGVSVQMQTLQQLVSEASERLPHTKVFVLPELVGGDWSINKIWWSRISKLLTTRNQ